MSLNEEAALEVDALRAIYCRDGEMREIQEKNTWRIWIELDITLGLENSKSSSSSSCGIVQFSLPHDYPKAALPLVDIKCPSLDDRVIETITKTLGGRARELQGEMMLLDLACLAKELVENELDSLVNSTEKHDTRETTHRSLQVETESSIQKLSQVHISESCSQEPSVSDHSSLSTAVTIAHGPLGQAARARSSSDSIVTTLMHLDHMRSKSSYSKLIRKWAEELNLTGRLIFCKRLIFILLQGNAGSVKEYIVRNRTMNVDVDSRGRSCKERMLSVLCEVVVVHSQQELGEFSVAEFTPEELAVFFKQHCMEAMYIDHIKHLLMGLTRGSRIT